MSLFQEINEYIPYNEQEEKDRKQMLQFMELHEDCLERRNEIGHFTASVWVVNREKTKVLMVYHNIYHSWSWIGGHADGIENLQEVALRELCEETGIAHVKLLKDGIFSLETLPVFGHVKKGVWVPSHLHFNLTYLVEVDENDELRIKEDENSGVKWWENEEALRASSESWMVEKIYKKLLEKQKRH